MRLAVSIKEAEKAHSRLRVLLATDQTMVKSLSRVVVMQHVLERLVLMLVCPI